MLAEVADGAKIQALMPYLRAEVDAQMDRIDTVADQKLLNGELDPQMALQLWVEKTALRRILRGFEQKARIGVAVGERIGPELALP